MEKGQIAWFHGFKYRLLSRLLNNEVNKYYWKCYEIDKKGNETKFTVYILESELESCG